MNPLVLGAAKGLARANTVIRARAVQLLDLMSSRRCPDEFVHELGSVVGLTDDVPLTQYLTTPDQWRAAIDVAPAVWNEKGTQPATRHLIQFLAAGARHAIFDWFGYRTLAGLSGFPWYGTSDAGEYITHLHVQDPDGNLDRDAVMAAVETNLNIGENAVVAFVHFVENWFELWRWTQAGTTTLGAHRVTLANGELGMSGVDTSTWAAVANVWIAYIDTADTANFAFRWQPSPSTDGYYVSITQGPAAGTGLVELYRSSGGPPALAASAAADIRGFPAPAEGTMTVVAGAALVDGETFTLPDGVGQTGVFEFDDDGVVTPGNIAVPFNAALNADQVGVAVEKAINENTVGLRIGALYAGASVVDLVHHLETVAGNQTTSETVAAGAFVLTNMAGAVGPEGVRLDVQTFPTVGPALDIKVVVDGVHLFTWNDAAPIGVGHNRMLTLGANVADILYHEVVPLAAQDIRTLP